MFQVGLAFKTGAGVVEDRAQAATWFRKAGGVGHARAQYQMGQACAQGKGVAQDEQEAVHWYRMAARQEHQWSLLQLGIAYYLGCGVAQDVARAKTCWEQAAALGNVKAGRALVQIAEAMDEQVKIAAPWLFDEVRERRRADAGDVDAQRMMGFVYKRGAWWGRGERDGGCTVVWTGGGPGGRRGAVSRWGRPAQKARAWTRTCEEAASFYTFAALQGHARAQYQMGQARAKGVGVAKNPEEAAKWFRKAAEQGHEWAQYKLATLYRKGDGVRRQQRRRAPVVWPRGCAGQREGRRRHCGTWRPRRMARPRRVARPPGQLPDGAASAQGGGAENGDARAPAPAVPSAVGAGGGMVARTMHPGDAPRTFPHDDL